MLALMFFAVPAMADNEEFDNADNFTAYNKTRGVVHLKFLAFSEGGYNHWAGTKNGRRTKIYLKYPDGRTVPVMYYTGDNDLNPKKGQTGYVWLYFERNMGSVVVTNQNSGTRSDPYDYLHDHKFLVTRDAGGRRRVYGEVDWYMPEELTLQKFEIRIDVTDERTNYTWFHDYKMLSYTGADALPAPELYSATFYPSKGVTSSGRAFVAVPYSTSYTPKQYTTSQNSTPIPTDKMADILTVETKDTEQRFKVTMDVYPNKDVNMTTQLTSNEIIIPAYHSINNFSVTDCMDSLYAENTSLRGERKYLALFYNGVRRLNWDILHANYSDIMDMDLFEVQRAYKEDFSDAQTIGSVQYNPILFKGETSDEKEELTQHYEYIDSTEYATYNRVDRNKPIYYRVRRASSASWGWDHAYAASGTTKITPVSAGLDQPYILRDGTIYETRYKENHEVAIRIRTPEHTDGSQRPLDRKAQIKVVRDDANGGEVSFTIPADSMKLRCYENYSGFRNVYWEYIFVDEMPTACLHYHYTVSMDTTNLRLMTFDKNNPEGTYDQQKAVVQSNGSAISYFEDIPAIDVIEATQGEHKRDVVIKWKPAGSGIETYDLYRDGKRIALNLVDNYFVDSTAVVGKVHEYYVKGYLTCRKQQTTTSKKCTGFRSPYGSISGRVLNQNGSALSGVKIRIVRSSDENSSYPDGVDPKTIKDEYLCESVEDGTFFIDSIPYALTGSSFQVIPESPYALFDHEYSDVNVHPEQPEASVKDFVNSAMVVLSGRVLYHGSTVPVSGAHFLLDGNPLKSANGQYISTDNLGNFSVTVPRNYKFTLQAVKDGHVFAEDGYFMYNGKREIILEKNLPGVRLYDQTKVRLIGRVAGGNIEGDKELGFGLSANNLGDNLQLVLELEGDNVSHLVFDENDPDHKTRTEEYTHLADGQTTKVHTTTKRITITPDVTTGEFQLDLYPARYRVVQATADGYASLLAAGTAIPVVDLTDSIRSYTITSEAGTVPYNAQYKVIYHSPVSVTYAQMQYGYPMSYMGEKQFSFMNVSMQEHPLQLIRNNPEKPYVLGYPLFISGGVYNVRVQAHEDYYYNNDMGANHTQVMMANCPVKLYNGLDNSAEVLEGELDEEGTHTFTLMANNADFSITGQDALRTISVSVCMDGEYIEATPLQGYVTGSRIKGGNSINNPNIEEVHRTVSVVDVLRDPPGANSYAYIETGSSYTTTYDVNCSVVYGTNVDIKIGSAYNNVAGVSAGAGPFAGTVIEGSSSNVIPISLTWKHVNNKGYTYSFESTERIQTSTDPGSTGMPSTVFIGFEPCVYTTINEAFCVIDREAYLRILPAVKSGNVRVVAEGVSESGDSIYLAICEELGLATGFDGYFAYSANYIETMLIPKLLRERNALLRLGSRLEVQQIADKTGKRQYRSTVDVDDKEFGMKYEIIDPNGKTTTGEMDRVDGYNAYLLKWAEVLKKEECTLLATRYNKGGLLKTYNVAGSSIEHSETTTYSTTYQSKDETPTAGGFFGGSGAEVATGVAQFAFDALCDKVSTDLATQFTNLLTDYRSASTAKEDIEGKTPGGMWKIEISPVVDVDMNNSNSAEEGHTRTIGFVLEDDPFTHMNVEVFRVTDETNGFARDAYRAFKDAADYNEYIVYNNKVKYADYVYYVNGGATRAPHRGPAYTTYYMPGTKIDEGTLNLEIPHLSLNTYEISNVPDGESAFFDLQISVESESREVPDTEREYKLFLLDDSNPNGAGIFIDGQAIAGGRTFNLVPGETVFHKKLEVRRGEGYDFEDIVLRLRSVDDDDCYTDAKFSVHYIPSSCPVQLALISHNWLLNTNSPQDSLGYYMPVEIGGFDATYHNFDHIEFQYKLTSQSNDAWVNLCSYYADPELYDRATGTKAMIDGGIIGNIRFRGERDPMEQQYDLRAVSFCRLGTGYVSRSSEVLTGRKDTRNPQVFGSISPKNGILGPGDYISIPFSEDIAANYLDEDNNFQVVGYTNGSGITSTTSLRFDGSEGCVATSQSQRTVGRRGFTVDMMVKPADPKADYTYFSLPDAVRNMAVTFGQRDGRLRLFMKGFDWRKVAYSKPLPSEMGWTRVAVTYDAETGMVRFFNGSEDISDPAQSTVGAGFSLTGHLNMGGGDSEGNNFNGNMLETRLWNYPLDPAMLAHTNQKTLSGYEHGLLAYYPMNEGRSAYAKDKAHGADLVLHGTSWSLPAGRSLHFDASNKEGVRLDPKAFERNAMSDYTLSLWFKAEEQQAQDTVAIFAAGRGIDSELNAKGGLFIGLEGGRLAVRQNGFSVVSESSYQDNEWHNVAVTVAHDVNAAALYVDGEQLRSFAGDVLTGIFTSDLRLGACQWATVAADSSVVTGDKFPFRGYIDDVTLYNTAKTIDQYNLMIGRTPLLDDMSLLSYLGFERSRLSSNGVLEVDFSPYNGKKYSDANGKPVTKDERLILDDDAKLASMTGTVTAPINDAAAPTKLAFSWVGKDNELVLNVKMSDYEINHQNIMLTVRDVEDKAGNMLASPISWTVFVDKNPLKWCDKFLNMETPMGTEVQELTKVHNRTGKAMRYTISNVPEWLKLSMTEDYIEPDEESPVTITVSDDLEPGYHTALLQLMDDDGLSDPLMVSVHVYALAPYFEVDNHLTQSMNVVAQVMVPSVTNAYEYVVDMDEDDIIYAFIDDVCVGKQNISRTTGTSANLMITVHGEEALRGKDIRFNLWQASTGKIFVLSHERDSITFADNTLYGTTAAPVVMRTSGKMLQTIDLNEGWNWVSFYTAPEKLESALRMTSGFTPNDQIKTYYSQKGFASYMGGGKWQGDLKQLDYRQMYMVYVDSYTKMFVEGYRLKSDSDRLIPIGHGWNELPYLLEYDEDVNTALSDYFPYASQGDMVKGYDDFALFDAASGKWIGSLKKLYSGRGYMLQSMVSEPCLIMYRSHQAATAGGNTESQARAYRAPLYATSRGTNMPVVATVQSSQFQVEPGDQLQAYVAGQLAGEAKADSEGRFYLMAHANDGDQLTFTLTRAGEQVATSLQQLPYNSRAVKGSIQQPYVISFDLDVTDADAQGAYYDLQGRHAGQPSRKGIYVRKNQKVVVK